MKINLFNDIICSEHKEGGTMDTRQLALRYQDLVKDIDVATKAADDIAGYMKSLEANQIIRLSENFREFSSMDWFINWSGVDINLWEKIFPNRESYLWVLRLGTFHITSDIVCCFSSHIYVFY